VLYFSQFADGHTVYELGTDYWILWLNFWMGVSHQNISRSVHDTTGQTMVNVILRVF